MWDYNCFAKHNASYQRDRDIKLRVATKLRVSHESAAGEINSVN